MMDNFIKRDINFLFFLCISGFLSFFFFDKQILNWTDFFNAKFFPIFTIFSHFISPLLFFITWTSLFLFVRFTLRHYALIPLFFEIFTTQAISLAIAYLSKVLIGRARPDIFLKEGIYGLYGWHFDPYYHSFPSGHSIVICTLATTLSFLYPRYRLQLYAAAIVLSFSRVLIAKHYFSDILGTCILAIISATIVHGFFKNLISPS